VAFCAARIRRAFASGQGGPCRQLERVQYTCVRGICLSAASTGKELSPDTGAILPSRSKLPKLALGDSVEVAEP
jgi:hypothetical protein